MVKKRNCEIRELKEEREALRNSLSECMEAIRKNLAYSQYKDEEVLYTAYKNAETTLGKY